MQGQSILPVACRLNDLPLSAESVSALVESLVSRRSDSLWTAAQRDPLLSARLLAWPPIQQQVREPCGLSHVLSRFNASRAVAFASSALSIHLDPERSSFSENCRGEQADRLFRTLRVYAHRVANQTHDDAVSQGQQDPETIFLVALLESLGQFVLAYCFAADYTDLLVASPSPADLQSKEVARFGADAQTIGRRLARSWGLPDWIAAFSEQGANPYRSSQTVEHHFHELRAVVERGETEEAVVDPSHDGSTYYINRETLGDLVGLATERDRLLTQRRETLEEEKLEALAEFAAGAGHEINNPLAVIYGRAQMLLADETDPERRRALLAMGTQAMRIHEMIADLMLFARPPKPERERLDLSPLVTETIASLAAKAEEKAVTLRFAPPALPVEAWGDPVQVRVVLGNLITNSLESLGQGGSVEVSLRKKKAPAALPAKGANDSADLPRSTASAVVRVRDDGPGMTDDIRRHLFDPFFSGRQAGRGLGLGLGKCWRIVEAHGGKIRVKSRPGEGTTFSIWLPGCPVQVVDEPSGNGHA